MDCGLTAMLLSLPVRELARHMSLGDIVPAATAPPAAEPTPPLLLLDDDDCSSSGSGTNSLAISCHGMAVV